MTSLLLGIDFGGTKNAIILSEFGTSHWLGHRRQFSLPNSNAESNLNAVLKMSRELLLLHDGQLLAVGVSFGGPVNFKSGMVKLSYHVPGWENYALRERLEHEFGVPISIDNDANVGAIGEWQYGAGSKCSSMLYITVSTGIGSGWIINGKPYRGKDDMAGEIGHLRVRPEGAFCSCGKRGCLEAMACGPAIARRARSRLNEDSIAGQKLRSLCNNHLEEITAEMVSQAANEGDKLAEEVLREGANYLGIGIGQVLTLMNPDRVVLGGGVSKAGNIYWEEVRETAKKHSLSAISTKIIPAKFKDEAPLWGTLVLANNLIMDSSKDTTCS